MSGRKQRLGQLNDRLINSLVERYHATNDLTDIDAVIEFLKSSNPQLRRLKTAPLRLQVTRVVNNVLRRKADISDLDQVRKLMAFGQIF